jgi:hypothetical protein
MPAVNLVTPDGDVPLVHHELAERPATVAGGWIAIIENTKPNARTMLTAIANQLVVAHAAAGYRVFSKPNPAVPFRQNDLAAISECDFVLTGSGD